MCWQFPRHGVLRILRANCSLLCGYCLSFRPKTSEYASLLFAIPRRLGLFSITTTTRPTTSTSSSLLLTSLLMLVLVGPKMTHLRI